MRGLVLVNGGRSRCPDSGGDGPAVVLLHGDWTDSALWAPLIPLLRDDFRVIGYDELAYGGSPPPNPAYTPPAARRSPLFSAGRARGPAAAGSNSGFVPGPPRPPPPDGGRPRAGSPGS